MTVARPMIRTRILAYPFACVLALPLLHAAEPAIPAQPVAPGHEQAFLADCAAKAAAAEAAETSVIAGKDGWLFLAAEVRHLGVGPFWGEAAAKASRASKPEWADPLPAILDFKAQLDKAGIELLLVPVPAKAAIYPDMLSEKAPMGKPGDLPMRVDQVHQAFYKILEGNGIKVLDIGPLFAAARADDARQGPVYCRTDSHWSSRACGLAAKAIAERIGDRPWLKELKKRTFQAQTTEAEFSGDLTRLLGTGAAEKLPMTVVQEETAAGPAPVDSWRDSPVVQLGDSHNLVFHGGDDMLFTGAGLADQLAAQLGVPVDLVGVRGSGATPARRNLARRGDSLAGKKLVIWCFTVREFSEGQGWAKVPVIRTAK